MRIRALLLPLPNFFATNFRNYGTFSFDVLTNSVLRDAAVRFLRAAAGDWRDGVATGFQSGRNARPCDEAGPKGGPSRHPDRPRNSPSSPVEASPHRASSPFAAPDDCREI